MYNYAHARLGEAVKGLIVTITALALMLPAYPEDKGTYVAKKEKAVKKKKKLKRKRTVYPAKVNPRGEDIKIKDMLKDIYE